MNVLLHALRHPVSVMCLVETQVEDTLELMVFDCFCIDICDMISILKLTKYHVSFKMVKREF